jgi:hypothetical protein
VPELPDLSRAKALEPLVDRLAELKSPARVAIDGPDAAGKTTLGQELATSLPSGGDGAEAERFYRARYLPGQRLYDSQARPRERADVVVENDDVERPRLLWREGVLPPGA